MAPVSWLLTIFVDIMISMIIGWSSSLSADHRRLHHARLDHQHDRRYHHDRLNDQLIIVLIISCSTWWCHHHDNLGHQVINLVMPESLSVSEKMKLVVSRAAGLRLLSIFSFPFISIASSSLTSSTLSLLCPPRRVFSLSDSSASSLPKMSTSSSLTS